MHDEKFQLFVMNKLIQISDRIAKLEGKAAMMGAFAGAFASVVGEIVLKAFWH